MLTRATIRSVAAAGPALRAQALPALSTIAVRHFTRNFGLDDGSSHAQWPETKLNTCAAHASRPSSIFRSDFRRLRSVLNIVPQGFVHVIERFGRLNSIQYSGMYFAVPRAFCHCPPSVRSATRISVLRSIGATRSVV